MTTSNFKQSPIIKKYMKRLVRELNHLSEADRAEIVREIEEHIVERWEVDSKGEFDENSLHGVLGKMGTPEYIAGQYCAERGWAKPPKKHTLRNVILTATAVVVLGSVALGYIGMKFIFLPIRNLISGKVVEVNDNGVKILNGLVSVGNDGVQVKGIVDIKDSGITVGKGISLGDMTKLLSSEAVASEDQKIELLADGIGKVEIDIPYAQMKISGQDTNKIEVNYKKKVFGTSKEDAQEVLSKMDIKQSREGDKLELIGEYPDRDNLPSNIKAIGFEVTITMPKRLSAGITGKYGNIDVKDLEGSLTVDTKYANTNISNIGTNCNVIGKYGRVEIANVGGLAEVENAYGKSYIDGVAGNLSLNTKYGEAQVKKIAGNIEMDAKYGTVNLAIPETYGFKLEAEAKYGTINTDFVTEHRDGKVLALVGDGAHKVTIDTKYGTVIMKKGE